MGDKTGIAWTDATWNPVTGCTKVSAGCKHCYAERVFPRAYAGQTTRKSIPGSTGWIERPRQFTDVMTHPDRLDQPLRWRKPRRVFVNSMSDLFHDDVPDEFIAQVFAVMALAPHHTFQILTKRPERMQWILSSDGFSIMVNYACDHIEHVPRDLLRQQLPLPNVWLGVSVEDQATADQRIPLLLETPAALRFVSYEPALGPVNFNRIPAPVDRMSAAIDWIIVGGESGSKARPFDVQWARDTIRQCRDAGVACFVKQLGAHPIQKEAPEIHAGVEIIKRTRLNLKHRAGADIDEWPADLRVQEWPEVA